VRVGDIVRVRVEWSIFNGLRGEVVKVFSVDCVAEVKLEVSGLVVPFAVNELEVEIT
jgi:hypothetical protein